MRTLLSRRDFIKTSAVAAGLQFPAWRTRAAAAAQSARTIARGPFQPTWESLVQMSFFDFVWQHLKHVELRNLCCTDFDHLSVEFHLALRRLRRRPDLIQSYFTGAGLYL